MRKLILLIGPFLVISACSQGNVDEQQLIDQLKQEQDYKEYVDIVIEFRQLRGTFQFPPDYMTNLSEAERKSYQKDYSDFKALQKSVRSFRREFFDSNPNPPKGLILTKVKAFINATPYSEKVKNVELGINEITFNSKMKKLISNLEMKYPSITSESIIHMASEDAAKAIY